MKKIADLTKRAMKWYFTQYARVYGENYLKYGYKCY